MNGRGPFPWRQHVIILLVIVLVTALPYLISLATFGFAQAIDCDLGTFVTDPCLVLGSDWRDLLVNLYGLGWMVIATLPLGGGAFIAWSVIAIIHRIAWGRMQKAEGQ